MIRSKIDDLIPLFKDEVHLRNDGECAYLTVGEYYAPLNDSGRRVVELIDSEKSVGDISQAISNEYGITYEVAFDRILAFIVSLWEKGIYFTDSMDHELMLLGQNDGLITIPPSCCPDDYPVRFLTNYIAPTFIKSSSDLAQLFNSSPIGIVGELGNGGKLESIFAFSTIYSEDTYFLIGVFGQAPSSPTRLFDALKELNLKKGSKKEIIELITFSDEEDLQTICPDARLIGKLDKALKNGGDLLVYQLN